MAKLRRFAAYRRLERPYTRKSKFKEASFVKANPNIRVVRFDMGNSKGSFDRTLQLVSRTGLQIRGNALESARTSSNKMLEEGIGKGSYHLKLLLYPHHILRENPLASGAGADRMSTGMKKSFGKPIGAAAQLRPGQVLFRLRVNKRNMKLAKSALRRVAQKIPGSYSIVDAS